MKNMKKIIAVLLSMTAIASTTAFAAVRTDIEADYTSGKASLALEDTSITPAANGQITVVIVPKDAKTIDSENIYYINQGDFATEMLGENGILKNMLVKEEYDADAEKYPQGYEVRIGGLADGTYDTFYFKVEEEEVIVYGDADGNGAIANADAVKIFQYVAAEDKTAIVINSANADADGNGAIANADAVRIFQYVAAENKDDVILGPAK